MCEDWNTVCDTRRKLTSDECNIRMSRSCETAVLTELGYLCLALKLTINKQDLSSAVLSLR